MATTTTIAPPGAAILVDKLPGKGRRGVYMPQSCSGCTRTWKPATYKEAIRHKCPRCRTRRMQGFVPNSVSVWNARKKIVVSKWRNGTNRYLIACAARGCQTLVAWNCRKIGAICSLCLDVKRKKNHTLRKCANPSCGKAFRLTRSNRRKVCDTCVSRVLFGQSVRSDLIWSQRDRIVGHKKNVSGRGGVWIFKCIAAGCQTLRHSGAGRRVPELCPKHAMRVSKIKPFAIGYKSMCVGASSRGIACEISYQEYVKMCARNPPCVYCGAAITWTRSYAGPRNSRQKNTGCNLDRVDNTKGYVQGNVVPCCFACNTTKGEMLTGKEMAIVGLMRSGRLEDVGDYLRRKMPPRAWGVENWHCSVEELLAAKAKKRKIALDRKTKSQRIIDKKSEF